jgi:hypothetical protein
MSSERKSIQARINGAKSHGPKTPEGKRASSQNARTHGLGSQFVVFDGESEDEFNQHWQEFIDEHQPCTPTERELVHRLAVASWRLHRCYAREASIIKLKMIDQRESLDDDYDDLTPADHAAYAFRSLADTGRALELLNRYETRDRRAFDQSLRTLLQLKSARIQKQALAPRPTTHHPPPTTVFPNEPNPPGQRISDITYNVDENTLNGSSDRNPFQDLPQRREGPG